MIPTDLTIKLPPAVEAKILVLLDHADKLLDTAGVCLYALIALCGVWAAVGLFRLLRG